MRKLWAFLSDPKNLAALTALAGALAFLWNKLETKPHPAAPSRAAVATQQAQAGGSGHAINAAGGSVVSIGAPAHPAAKPAAATPDVALDQTATSKEGHAVNANGGSSVQITGTP